MNENIVRELDKNYEETQELCNTIYQSNFSNNFEKVKELHTRMQSDYHPITDEELEYILTVLPLNLFAVSESLNKLRLKLEVTKLTNTRKEIEFRNHSRDTLTPVNAGNKTLLSQLVAEETTQNMTEYKIYETCYASVISRVEGELVYSRELIMGAKKVWDSRRSSEASNPVGPVVPETPKLPLYTA